MEESPELKNQDWSVNATLVKSEPKEKESESLFGLTFEPQVTSQQREGKNGSFLAYISEEDMNDELDLQKTDGVQKLVGMLKADLPESSVVQLSDGLNIKARKSETDSDDFPTVICSPQTLNSGDSGLITHCNTKPHNVTLSAGEGGGISSAMHTAETDACSSPLLTSCPLPQGNVLGFKPGCDAEPHKTTSSAVTINPMISDKDTRTCSDPQKIVCSVLPCHLGQCDINFASDNNKVVSKEGADDLSVDNGATMPRTHMLSAESSKHVFKSSSDLEARNVDSSSKSCTTVTDTIVTTEADTDLSHVPGISRKIERSRLGSTTELHHLLNYPYGKSVYVHSRVSRHVSMDKQVKECMASDKLTPRRAKTEALFKRKIEKEEKIRLKEDRINHTEEVKRRREFGKRLKVDLKKVVKVQVTSIHNVLPYVVLGSNLFTPSQDSETIKSTNPLLEMNNESTNSNLPPCKREEEGMVFAPNSNNSTLSDIVQKASNVPSSSTLSQSIESQLKAEPCEFTETATKMDNSGHSSSNLQPSKAESKTDMTAVGQCVQRRAKLEAECKMKRSELEKEEAKTKKKMRKEIRERKRKREKKLRRQANFATMETLLRDNLLEVLRMLEAEKEEDVGTRGELACLIWDIERVRPRSQKRIERKTSNKVSRKRIPAGGTQNDTGKKLIILRETGLQGQPRQRRHWPKEQVRFQASSRRKGFHVPKRIFCWLCDEDFSCQKDLDKHWETCEQRSSLSKEAIAHISKNPVYLIPSIIGIMLISSKHKRSNWSRCVECNLAFPKIFAPHLRNAHDDIKMCKRCFEQVAKDEIFDLLQATTVTTEPSDMALSDPHTAIKQEPGTSRWGTMEASTPVPGGPTWSQVTVKQKPGPDRTDVTKAPTHDPPGSWSHFVVKKEPGTSGQDPTEGSTTDPHDPWSEFSIQMTVEPETTEGWELESDEADDQDYAVNRPSCEDKVRTLELCRVCFCIFPQEVLRRPRGRLFLPMCTPCVGKMLSTKKYTPKSKTD